MALTVGGLLDKGRTHLSTLIAYTHVPALPLLIFLVVPPALAGLLALAPGRPVAYRVPILCLALVTSAYFLWWLFIPVAEMAWPRRIVDGLILQQCLAIGLIPGVATAWRIERPAPQRWWPRWSAGAVGAIGLVALVPAQGFLLKEGELILRPAPVPGYAADLLQAAAAVRALPPDAAIFGTGWWQSPVLALFAQRRMLNFQHWMPQDVDALPQKYLVTDKDAQTMARPDIDAVLASTEYRTVIESPGGSIYELLKVNPYAPFGQQDYDIAGLAADYVVADVDYPHLRGIYSRTGEMAWARPDGAVMLRRSDEDRLTLDISVPPKILEQTGPAAAPMLRVSSPGCLDQTVPIRVVWRQTLSFHLDCAPWDQPRAFPVVFHLDRHMPFVHQIDSDNRLLGFLLFSVGLMRPGAALPAP
jgi:hypothetical protein